MEKDKIIEFLDSRKEFYPEFIPPHIREKIQYGYHSDTDQIICHLGLIDIETSAYFKFFKILKAQFNLIHKKIFEASCGLIPILSSIIQENTSAKCTAVDRKILFENYKGVSTTELNIDDNIDLSPYDLIIGFRSCGATNSVVKNCFKYKKSFVIYLCPCNHLNNAPYNPSAPNEWHNYLISKIQANDNYDVTVLTNHGLQDNLPIIIAKIKQNLYNCK